MPCTMKKEILNHVRVKEGVFVFPPPYKRRVSRRLGTSVAGLFYLRVVTKSIYGTHNDF